MRASLKSKKDRSCQQHRWEPAKPQRKNPHCCMLHIRVAGGKRQGAGASRCLLQPRLERQQSLIIMTLHKLRFNVNKETNIIISQLPTRRSPTQSAHSLDLVFSPPNRLSASWPDVKVRAQTWRIICDCRKIFPAAAFSCHMQLAVAIAIAAI